MGAGMILGGLLLAIWSFAADVTLLFYAGVAMVVIGIIQDHQETKG